MADEERRKYELEGPARPKVTLGQLAEILGYEDAASVRALVREGKLPQPKGIGSHQYYSGLDLAVILEYFGRWQPSGENAPERAKTSENAPKRGKTRENEAERESQE